jgi:hypothetical protein
MLFDVAFIEWKGKSGDPLSDKNPRPIRKRCRPNQNAIYLTTIERFTSSGMQILKHADGRQDILALWYGCLVWMLHRRSMRPPELNVTVCRSSGEVSPESGLAAGSAAAPWPKEH